MKPVRKHRKHFCSILTNLSKLSHSKWSFLFHLMFLLLSSVLLLLQNSFQKCSCSQMFFKKGISRHSQISQYSQDVLESFFNKVTGLMACNFIKKETLTQVFSFEYHKIFMNSYFDGTPLVAASANV